MSFETLSAPVKAAAATEPVRVGVQVRGETSPSRLFVLVRREVVAPLSKANTRWSVELGKAEDKHLLRLRVDPKGEFALSATPNGRGAPAESPLRLLLGPHERWPICKVKAQGASYTVGKNYIDITLPAWAWEPTEKSATEKRSAGRA